MGGIRTRFTKISLKIFQIFNFVVIFGFLLCFAQKDPLSQIYLNYNESAGFDHWLGYARNYHRHFRQFYHSSDVVSFLEIGVQYGGSTRIWSQYFGKRLNYTGLDINPTCKRYEDLSKGIRIHIGSQLNKNDLDYVCRTFGPFDIIVDDGGHHIEMWITSFNSLFTCMKDSGVYVIEDLHYAYIARGRSGVLYQGKDIYGHIADYQRRMVSYWTREGMRPDGHPSAFTKDPFISHLASVHVYDSIVFFKYQEKWRPEKRVQRGILSNTSSSKRSWWSWWFLG